MESHLKKSYNEIMKTIIVLFLALAVSSPLAALGRRDSVSEKESSVERIMEGRVRLVGNEPFTRLIFVSDLGGSFEFPQEQRREFSAYQGQRIRLRDQGGIDLENPVVLPAPGIYGLLVEPEFLAVIEDSEDHEGW